MIAAEVEEVPSFSGRQQNSFVQSCNRPSSPAGVNVQDSFFIGEKMERAYITTLPRRLP